VELSIKDDGKGFDVEARMNDPFHFGVIGMHQRAERIGATIHIDSFPGKGCSVTLSLPKFEENKSL
jgi:signal transduction histidine kinase